MHPILAIWWYALALSAVAVLGMAQLIVVRRLREAMDDEQAHERRRVRSALVRVALGEAGEADRLMGRRARRRCAAEQLAELVGVLRGAELQRVAAELRRIGFHERLLLVARRAKRRHRLTALEALTAFPGEDTVDTLRTVAQEPNPSVSLAAWKTLWALGEPVRLADLERDARGMGRTLDRLELAGRIAEADPAQAVPYLRDARISDIVRVRLLDGVAESLWPGGLPVMVDLADAGTSAPVRAAAVRALGRFRYCPAEALLADALAAPEWEVRAEAATAVAACRAAGLIERLGELLEDDVWLVRRNAGVALTRLAGAGRRKLMQLAEAGPPRSRRIAEYLLSGAMG